jgi:hypothetical protein
VNQFMPAAFFNFNRRAQRLIQKRNARRELLQPGRRFDPRPLKAPTCATNG